MKVYLLLGALFIGVGMSLAQSLPDNFRFNEDLKRIQIANEELDDFYNEVKIDSVYIEFFDAGYWNAMHENSNTSNYVLARLKYQGTTYDSVAVQFKGQTSYTKASQNGSEKLSFDVKIDEIINKQDIDGYNTFNFNNAYQDYSMMKEVVYAHLSRKYVPAVRGNFIRLFLNGQDWGLYPNIEQVNGDFLKEWFKNNNGSRWRADVPADATQTAPDTNERPPGGGGGGGSNWGKGLAALNFLGNDASVYQEHYTLKNSELENPWSDLVKVCGVLNNTPLENLKDSLPNYLNVDATLWFLAQEIAFSDDDSYVHKGTMDYYLYFDEETRLMVPYEFDGNSAMANNNIDWSPFMNEDNENYPLLHRMLAVPEYRQRYIAHMKTILNNCFNQEAVALVNQYDNLISSHVQSDPKKDFNFNQYNNQRNGLIGFINNRPGNVNSNTEMQSESPVISNLKHKVGGVDWSSPKIDEEVVVQVQASHSKGIQKMYLNYSLGLYEKFNRILMNDEGKDGDQTAGDGVYAATILATQSNIYVRYYVEAVANDGVQTVSYEPEGAEYDVYYYKVELTDSENSPVVINEFMASNNGVMADEAGEYDDWIELYNTSDQDVSLNGFYLTDNADKLNKWMLPDTIIEARSYIIFWADEDQEQGPTHTNFKLSAGGEEIYLVEPSGLIADGVVYGEQQTDMAYARIPNGEGYFQMNVATFDGQNQDANSFSQISSAEKNVYVYPNPSSEMINVKYNGEQPERIIISNMLGQVMYDGSYFEKMDVSNYTSGVYIFKSEKGSILLQVQ